MPELPEVETIKRELGNILIGKRLDSPVILVSKAIKSDIDEYRDGIKGNSIISLSRKGKSLLIHLENSHYILFHLRMEGKLYVVKKDGIDKKHLTLFIPFQESDEGLAFYDTRKFGISLYADESDQTPLSRIGPDPFEVKDSYLIFKKYHASEKMLKELLLDQSIMSGIGNIYANEILFRCRLSPFMKGSKLARKDFDSILDNSIAVLSEAINHNGSTIRTYHAKPGMDGSFQNLLNVYSKKGTECPTCHHRIEKAFVGGRGTEYCPHCQKTGVTIAITGKIASGKSLATYYFGKEGFLTFSCDECVHDLYHKESFLASIRKEFPYLFTPDLNKEEISKRLIDDKVFKKRYLSIVYRYVRAEINQFIISNDHRNKAIEVPVLFDAHMDDMFSIIVGVETTKQKEHLLARGDKIEKAIFNKMNSYDRYHDRITYILHTDGKKSELRAQVRDLARKLTSD